MLDVAGMPFLTSLDKLRSPCSKESLGYHVISFSPLLAVKGPLSLTYLGHKGFNDFCNESPMVLHAGC